MQATIARWCCGLQSDPQKHFGVFQSQIPFCLVDHPIAVLLHFSLRLVSAFVFHFLLRIFISCIAILLSSDF
jgi:hypothetical protein